MPTVNLTNPTNGTTADANLIANNNDALEAAINGALDETNFASGKIYTPSKLKQVSATDGQVLAWSAANSQWEPKTISIPEGATFLRPSVTEVVSTAAETTFLTQTITGGSMSTNKLLRAIVMGDILYNNGASQTLTLRFKLGGVTVLQSPGMTSNTGTATRMPFVMEVFIQNLGAANSQMIMAKLGTTGTSIGSTAVGVSSGSLLNGAEAGMFGGIITPTSVDTSVNVDFVLTAQWGTSTANLSFRPRSALIEIV